MTEKFTWEIPEGYEPNRPTDDEIEEAVKEFGLLTHSKYDDDYIEMGYDCYKSYLRVFKWFEEEYKIYKELSIGCLKKQGLLLVRIKWLEIEKADLEEQLAEKSEKDCL